MSDRVDLEHPTAGVLVEAHVLQHRAACELDAAYFGGRFWAAARRVGCLPRVSRAAGEAALAQRVGMALGRGLSPAAANYCRVYGG